jgi:hypothetical protein
MDRQRSAGYFEVRSMSAILERPMLARSESSLKHPRQLSAGSSKDLDAVLAETQHGWHQWRQI